MELLSPGQGPIWICELELRLSVVTGVNRNFFNLGRNKYKFDDLLDT